MSQKQEEGAEREPNDEEEEREPVRDVGLEPDKEEQIEVGKGEGMEMEKPSGELEPHEEEEPERVKEEEDRDDDDLEEGELERSFDSLLANASVTGVPSVETSVEGEEVNVSPDVLALIHKNLAFEEEEDDDEGQVADEEDEEADEEDDDDLEERQGVNPPPSASGSAQENWSYVHFKLQLDMGLQFNTLNGDAAVMSVDNIDLHNGGAPPQPVDRRVSEMSGYTAGSSSAASASSAQRTPTTDLTPRYSDATSFSTSTLSLQEAKLMQPQPLLSPKRMDYLKNKYWNHELIYYIVDYIDQVVTQVPREEEEGEGESYSQPIQVKRSSKRSLAKNPKRRKLEEIIEMPPGSKILFAKMKRYSIKYLPARSWSLLETGDFIISFYTNETRRVLKCHVFEDFENNKTDRKVIFLKPNKYGKRVPIPALVVNVEHTEEAVLCDLVTDEGDINQVHISFLYMTEDAILEIDPSRRRYLRVKEPKASTADAEDSETDKSTTSKSTVHIHGTEDECAIEASAVEFNLEADDQETTTEPEMPEELRGPHHILSQLSFSASSSSEDLDSKKQVSKIADGCDAEKQFYAPFIDMDIRCKYFTAHQKNCEMLGPLEAGEWFQEIPFMLTCSIQCISIEQAEVASEDERYTFSSLPFVFSHLVAQIKLAGGQIYENYSDVPIENRSDLLVIAPRPCLTTRYLESVANNAKIICHEWIMNCCKAKSLVPCQELPAGWSKETKRFINSFDRQGLYPFAGMEVKVTSQSRDNYFYEFWSRVISACGAEVKPTRRIKYRKDLIILQRGYRYARLPFAVTPDWVIQSIIHGEARKISAHEDYEYPLS